ADRERRAFDATDVHEEALARLLGVGDDEARVAGRDRALIADLAAALGVERRRARDELTLTARLETIDAPAARDQRQHARARALLLVAEELGRRQLARELVIDGVDRRVADVPAPALAPVDLLRLLVAFVVDAEALLAPD